MDLYEQLNAYKEEGYYPMHMPGHKRNSAFTMINPYSIDITEIDGFDNLYEAEGILERAMKRAAKLFHAKETLFLVNGSTGGILTAIAACTKRGDQILMARNSHKAVYNAVFINELKPVYLYPEVEEQLGISLSIKPEEVREKLSHFPEIKAIIITSPTYEGVVSDIREVANIAHEHNIPLIVDEAHGAHFGFHSKFPESAITQGADIVIQSVHKTLPSFTQTALFHINGTLVDERKVKKFYSIYQTSSPSYLFMAGIDHLITLLEQNRKELFELYSERLHKFNILASNLKHLNLWNPTLGTRCFGKDPSKIIITANHPDMKGKALYERLLQTYKIQPEMALKDYVLCMTSIGDTEEGFDRLIRAITDIDESLKKQPLEKEFKGNQFTQMLRAEKCKDQHEVWDYQRERVSLKKSVNKIVAEYVYLYPPGIPLLVPGEIMSQEILNQLLMFQASGLSLRGMEDLKAETVNVIDK